MFDLIADISQCSYWDTTKEIDSHFNHILNIIPCTSRLCLK